MTLYPDQIQELSELCGIASEFFDIFGKRHITSVETQEAILRAMKKNTESLEEIIREIDDMKLGPWKRFIEPVTVVSLTEQPLMLPIYVPIAEDDEDALSVSWTIEDEKGQVDEWFLPGDGITVSEERLISGTRYIKVDLVEILGRDIGYYRVTVVCAHPESVFPGGQKRMEKTVRVIITPDTCYLPSELQEGRAWGLSINLYSIRSGRNWGIGDFTDLKNIVGAVASLKGGFVGINPLHAIPNMIPFGISPYSPISRLYRNSIYLDLERVPEVKESEDARKRMLSEAFVAELDRLRKGEFIDYEKVMSMKQTMLKYAFDLFYEREYKGDTGRGTEFRRYLSQEGADLESFATYMAISEFMGREEESAEDCPDPKSLSSQIAGQKWPADYGDPSSSAVREFKRTRRKEILFYQYVQWIIDEQLRDVAREAENSGMTVGLYYDLAIGSVGGGADTWCCRDVIAGGIDVGAPPDDFNLNGQNWGFPPLIPEKLKETGYELFIQTIRKNMKYAGALRIDHALGMFRLFWIPRAMSPKEGAYVQCPSEDLLRIIALESVRSRTMVIAEDLGTIGDRARETLARFHMLSYRLFYFERNYPDASFVPPEEYPEMALCAVTTHDLPTLLGYWVGRDIEVKKLLGMYRDETQWREQVEERERDRELIIAALKSSNILPDDYPSDPAAITELSPELCLAVYRYLGLTPCKLVLASLDDITGTPDQQNMPGTVDEYPNWKRKATLNLEEIISDERITDLSRVLQIAMVRDRRERGE